MTKTEKFEFKELDAVGLETLDVISDAGRFNQWMYETIRPFCAGKILEIGSGIGNISEQFIEAGFDITLTDIRSQYCARLQTRFENNKNVRGIYVMDLVDPEFDSKYAVFFGQYDTIFALNVVEHIKDHEQAMVNAQKMLKKGGRIVILVPAYQWLYNGMDTDLEHYRRYSAKSLTDLLAGVGFQITYRQYFNFIGIFGWLFTGKILGKRTIPGDQMKLFNLLVPVFKVIDKLILSSAGLSVIAIGKKM